MKNKIKNQIIVTITFLFISITLIKAQENQESDLLINRNSIYSNLSMGYGSLSAMVYYERFLSKHEYFTTFYKIGTGLTYTYFDIDINLLAQYGILTGTKKHHLELGLGPYIKINLINNNRFIPLTSTIGWRIQKPGGHFIFRTGVSWPEGAYLGLGVSF